MSYTMSRGEQVLRRIIVQQLTEINYQKKVWKQRNQKTRKPTIHGRN